MARKKKELRSLSKALVRLAGLKSINNTLDMGNGISVVAYQALIKDGQEKLEKYNQFLSTLDGMSNELDALDKEINDYSGRVLAAVGAIYGKDSNEYEMAGGTRTSEKKRPSTPTPTNNAP